MCIPTRTHLTYNNDKPWFTAKLRQLRQAKEDPYRKGDKYTLEKEIRVVKRNYSEKIRIKFSSSDTASVWKGLKEITNPKTPSPSTVENQQLASRAPTPLPGGTDTAWDTPSGRGELCQGSVVCVMCSCLLCPYLVCFLSLLSVIIS